MVATIVLAFLWYAGCRCCEDPDGYDGGDGPRTPAPRSGSRSRGRDSPYSKPSSRLLYGDDDDDGGGGGTVGAPSPDRALIYKPDRGLTSPASRDAERYDETYSGFRDDYGSRAKGDGGGYRDVQDGFRGIGRRGRSPTPSYGVRTSDIEMSIGGDAGGEEEVLSGYRSARGARRRPDDDGGNFWSLLGGGEEEEEEEEEERRRGRGGGGGSPLVRSREASRSRVSSPASSRYGAPAYAPSAQPPSREDIWKGSDIDDWSVGGFFDNLFGGGDASPGYGGGGGAALAVPTSSYPGARASGSSGLRSTLRGLGSASQLWLSEVDDRIAFEIADALGAHPGSAPRLEMVRLGKLVGADGVTALAEALGKGGAPALQALHLSGNPLGDGGAASIAFDLLRAGGCPSLRDLQLNHCEIGEEGAISIAHALRDGGALALENLWMGGNAIGDRGAEALAEAITPRVGQGVGLRRLALYSNAIGDRGAVLLARAVETRRQERQHRPDLPTVTIMLWSNELHDPDTERTIAEVDAVGRQEGGDWIELTRSPHHFSPGGGAYNAIGSAAAAPVPSALASPYQYASPKGAAATPGYGTPVQSRYGMY